MKGAIRHSIPTKMKKGEINVKTPKTDKDTEQLIIGLYDSYIKTVLKNRSRTLCRRYYKRMTHECLIDDPNKCESKLHSNITHIASINIVDIQELHCEIYNDKIYDALMLLPTKQLIVIVLWYWYDWSTQEIAEYFNVTDRTIRNWHHQSILFLREKLRKV